VESFAQMLVRIQLLIRVLLQNGYTSMVVVKDHTWEQRCIESG
jgi:hypothetical protein